MNLVVVALLLGLNCALASKTHCKSFFEKLECCGGKKGKENLNQDPVEPLRDEIRVIEVGSLLLDDDNRITEKIVFYKNQKNVSLTGALNEAIERKTTREESKQQLQSKNREILDDSIKETCNPKEFDFEDMKIATKKSNNKKTSLLLIKDEKSDDNVDWLLDTGNTMPSRTIPNHYMNDFFNVENMEGQWDADQFDSPKDIDKFEFPRSETSQDRLMQIYKERLLEVRSASSASDDSVEDDSVEDTTTAMILDSNDLLTFKDKIKDKLNEYASVEKTDTENV